MDNEQRRMERRDFTYYMKVTDAASGNLLGYLVDISAGGFKLDCEKPIPSGKEFRLQLALSGDISTKTSMTFAARSIWSRPDYIDPTTFKVGFQITSIGPSDAEIFQRMFEKYASMKSNRR